MQATTKIAVCYHPNPATGFKIEVRRDNTRSRKNRAGRFVCATIRDNVATWSVRRCTEGAALQYAAELGYTDVVREEVPS